jgi:hypothetical protein
MATRKVVTRKVKGKATFLAPPNKISTGKTKGVVSKLNPPMPPAKPKKQGLFETLKNRVFSALRPPKKEENISPADKLFNRSELEERAKKALDSNKLSKIKDIEKAEKKGTPFKDFVRKDEAQSSALPEIISAEEMPNPDDKIAAKEKEIQDRADAEAAEAEANEPENPMQGDIFTSPDTSEEAVSHAINTLKNPENIKHFTELQDFEIKGIAALRASNTKTQIPVLEEFITEFENLRVSLARKGRVEISDVAKAALGGGGNQQADSFMKRFFQH